MPAISRVAVDDGPADILSVVLSSAWTCLHDTPENQKNQYFDEFIPNESILLDLAASHPVEFAAGLNEVLQSETPPTVDYFTTLPDVAFKGWGIYLIVLGKPGELYRVYIGSATNTDRGLLARWHEYDQDTGLPKYYKASLAEGFTVVHRGLLCWTPSIPPPALQPTFRLLFLLLEATFSYIFWAMRTPDGKDYGMAHLCLWDRHALEYIGLCSHCCLREGVLGEFSLSAEELEALAIKRKEHRAVWAKVYHQTQMETNYEEYTKKRAVHMSNFHHKQMETNYVEYNKRRAANNTNYRHMQLETNYHAYRAARNESVRKAKAAKHQYYRDYENANRAKHVVKQTYHCDVCNTSCANSSDLTKHKKTPKHRDTLIGKWKLKRFVCGPCRYGTNNPSTWKDHCQTKRHCRLINNSPSSQLG
jgi:hypothetical protein